MRDKSKFASHRVLAAKCENEQYAVNVENVRFFDKIGLHKMLVTGLKKNYPLVSV